MEDGPWIIVHGIDLCVWPTESGTWSMVSTIEYGQRKKDQGL